MLVISALLNNVDSLNICSVFILASIALLSDKLFVIEIADPVADTSNNTNSLLLGSLNEIREVLSHMGLGLGMSIDNWPPENIETLAKQIEDPY